MSRRMMAKPCILFPPCLSYDWEESLRKQLHHVKVSAQGLTFLHAPNSLGCKTRLWSQPNGESQKYFLFTPVYRLTVHYHNGTFCWACTVSCKRVGERQTAAGIILPHRLQGSSGGRWVGECTPALHRCLRGHEQKAGNIRMRLCEGDTDTERACHSCVAVMEDSCRAEHRTGILPC